MKKSSSSSKKGKSVTKVVEVKVSTPITDITDTTDTVAVNASTPVKPLYIAILIIIVGLASLAYYSRSMFLAAMVNGKPVWRWTLNQKLNSQYGKQTLDMLITQNLIEQEARNKGVVIADEQIASSAAQIEDMLKAQGQTLDQVLVMQGMTREDFNRDQRLNLLVETLATSEASVSAEEIANYVKTNTATLPEDLEGEKLDAYVSNLLSNQKRSQSIQTWLMNLRQGAKILTF